jgi:prepilin-type N-terminal cleavage/methylation domain-containing protein
MNNLQLKNNKEYGREGSALSLNAGGFTLVEILISVAILSGILILFTAFQSNVFSLNRSLQSSLQSQSEIKKIIRPFSNEVRSATQSNLGAYPIATADSDEFSFYVDTDNDGLRERIRYFLEDGQFRKGTIVPSGDPLVYNPSDEKIIKVIHNVINTEIFSYYDSGYDGTAESVALSTPVSPTDVRLIKIEVIVDDDPNKSPAPVTATTQVSMRNLKDNLQD